VFCSARQLKANLILDVLTSIMAIVLSRIASTDVLSMNSPNLNPCDYFLCKYLKDMCTGTTHVVDKLKLKQNKKNKQKKNSNIQIIAVTPRWSENGNIGTDFIHVNKFSRVQMLSFLTVDKRYSMSLVHTVNTSFIYKLFSKVHCANLTPKSFLYIKRVKVVPVLN
jgi:hypothetical protein